MKADIGEDIMYAWVRHEKKCRIAQMNWKPSKAWNDNGAHIDILKNAKEYFGEIDEFKDALPPKVERDQIIRQVECDVLAEDTEGKLLAIEVAMHIKGLGYGSPSENRNRVIKKLINIAIALDAFFPNKKATLIFATPKVHEKSDLSYVCEKLNKFFKQNVSGNYEVEIIAGYPDFRNKILTPLMKLLDNKQNASSYTELYLRSSLINKLFNC